jgi:hypothetical protein
MTATPTLRLTQTASENDRHTIALEWTGAAPAAEAAG